MKRISAIPRSDRRDDYFNWNLRNARISKGHTTGEVAQEAGVSKSMYNAYERLRAIPSPMVEERIARFLGETINELFSKQLREIYREIRREREGDGHQRHIKYLRGKVEAGTATPREERTLTQLESLANPISLSDIDEENIQSNIPGPEEASVEHTLQERINKILRTMTYREREILKLRYGIGEGQHYAQEEVGKIFKVTRARVGQIEAKAIRKLQYRMGKS